MNEGARIEAMLNTPTIVTRGDNTDNLNSLRQQAFRRQSLAYRKGAVVRSSDVSVACRWTGHLLNVMSEMIMIDCDTSRVFGDT